MTFELLVATRYLRAKRKQAMISVITLIAILGVGAGVGALVVALAVSEGQRQDIRNRLLGAQAHVTIYSASGGGIANYREVTEEIRKIPDVLGAAPHAEQGMAITSSSSLRGVRVTGILPDLDEQISLLSQNVIAGNFNDLKTVNNSIAIGKELASSLGLEVGSHVEIVSAELSGGLSGFERKRATLEVVAIFSIGLYEYDAGIVYIPFNVAAYLIGSGDVATNIEVKVRDIDSSELVGEAIMDKLPGFVYEDWKITHRPIFQALKLERLGMTIAIGLIVFVASLNIVALLTMMVLEKTRDIATLMAMGATAAQIRRIFMLQGVIIGGVGTALGLVLGHALSHFADKYQWITLSPDVYSIAYLPFRADLADSVVIAVAAVFISFLATLYPSASAARLQPVEALRYE